MVIIKKESGLKIKTFSSTRNEMKMQC